MRHSAQTGVRRGEYDRWIPVAPSPQDSHQSHGPHPSQQHRPWSTVEASGGRRVKSQSRNEPSVCQGLQSHLFLRIELNSLWWGAEEIGNDAISTRDWTGSAAMTIHPKVSVRNRRSWPGLRIQQFRHQSLSSHGRQGRWGARPDEIKVSGGSDKVRPRVLLGVVTAVSTASMGTSTSSGNDVTNSDSTFPLR